MNNWIPNFNHMFPVDYVNSAEQFLQSNFAWVAHKVKTVKVASVAVASLGAYGAYRSAYSLVKHVLIAKNHYFPPVQGSFGPYLPYLSVIKTMSDVCYYRIFAMNMGVTAVKLGMFTYNLCSNLNLLLLNYGQKISRDNLLSHASKELEEANSVVSLTQKELNEYVQLQMNLKVQVRAMSEGSLDSLPQNVIDRSSDQIKLDIAHLAEVHQQSISHMKHHLKEAATALRILSIFYSLLTTEQTTRMNKIQEDAIALIDQIASLDSTFIKSTVGESELPNEILDIIGEINVGNNNIYDQLRERGFEDADFQQMASTTVKNDFTISMAVKGVFSYSQLNKLFEDSQVNTNDKENVRRAIQDIRAGVVEQRQERQVAPIVVPTTYEKVKSSALRIAYQVDQLTSLYFARAFKIAAIYMATQLPISKKYVVLSALIGYTGLLTNTPFGNNSPSEFQKSGWAMRACWISYACNPVWYLSHAAGEIYKKGFKQAPAIILNKFWN